MTTALHTINRAVWLCAIPWLLVMVPMSAALARRTGFRVGMATLLAFIPVPFLAWIVILMSRGAHLVADRRSPDLLEISPPTSIDDVGLGDGV